MDIEIDKLDIKDLIRMGEDFPKAGARALNKVARSTRTFFSSETRQRYNIKKQDLDPNIRVRNAFHRQHELKATVTARSNRLRLYSFAPRPRSVKRPQKGAGVAIEVRRGNRQVLGGTFIAKMQSGHIGVFKRKGRARLPIRELYGPDVMKLFSSPYMKQKLTEFVSERLPVVLTQELKFFLRKARG